mmetsp:Transcript_14316/g.43101  ORF Transcript_14316/g.43101 Transcript_14316/m.43101 type:complete len:209 (-) Transcript_14316:205-831(-)|eukprot:CAMPEP_0177659718 /NCGR_PEP_ID=MMETSP0447-20121125/17602_1 /TAXON_ID=0 /ORGANISM="Stygamoeba regulata, Strain BSH-02190019" /LENGTH=208 /DNA_ID=CAMNT_0019164627 /DNA_START=245 /DNA_END=871 /DNA_ORIENTATION=+
MGQEESQPLSTVRRRREITVEARLNARPSAEAPSFTVFVALNQVSLRGDLVTRGNFSPAPGADGHQREMLVGISEAEQRAYGTCSADAVMLVYDVCDRAGFDKLHAWLSLPLCVEAPVRLLYGVRSVAQPARSATTAGARVKEEEEEEAAAAAAGEVPLSWLQEFTDKHGYYHYRKEPGETHGVMNLLARLLVDHYFPLEARLTKAAR